MDELEGGVRPSVFYSLAEPICNTRPWQGRSVPVHCVRAGNQALLLRTRTDRSRSAFLTVGLPLTSTFSFISGCFRVPLLRHYLTFIFFITATFFPFYCFLLVAERLRWSCSKKEEHHRSSAFLRINFLQYDWCFPASNTKQCELETVKMITWFYLPENIVVILSFLVLLHFCRCGSFILGCCGWYALEQLHQMMVASGVFRDLYCFALIWHVKVRQDDKVNILDGFVVSVSFEATWMERLRPYKECTLIKMRPFFLFACSNHSKDVLTAEICRHCKCGSRALVYVFTVTTNMLF